jgi:hypothetical protein
MKQKIINNQEGTIIRTLHPSTVVNAKIYSEEQRMKIKKLIQHNFLPHHTSVGIGKATRKHWNVEKCRGKYGKGFKMITSSPYSSNFNHLTYFIKEVAS